MKREEIKALFGENITQEQLDAIMKMNGEDINRAKAPIADLEAKLADANSQLATATSQIDEFNKQAAANMTQEEQLNALRESVLQSQRDLVLKSNRLDAKAKLKEIGIDDAAIESQLNLIVVEDAEQTQANTKALVDLIQAQRDATKAATEQSLLSQSLSPAGSTSNNGMTKEAFDKLSYAEASAYLQENPDFLSSIQSK
jgi:chromosome segregation ATPase